MWIKLCLLSTTIMVWSAVAAPDNTEAFTILQGLTGEWEATTPRGAVIRLSYRMVAAGSVLVETFKTQSGAETLTVYHRDGSALNATHYCAQGNQPRLRLDGASTNDDLLFTFYDGTNLVEPKTSHLIRMRLHLKDAGHLDKTEMYTQGGQEEVTVFHFARVSTQSGP